MRVRLLHGLIQVSVYMMVTYSYVSALASVT